ncbi:hypothetical protein Cgig2_016511 [Carnegiea gigantea]|uniref:Reverse transcriptase zinc-binding domain-containing protein n=1 Tax=Carnegiea gigantea TaxID=171969 RepID=A0A9Q1GFN3_9CARY|nr:hypothetical protein Cgig2_016511 [Carnegiea gigantea]
MEYAQTHYLPNRLSDHTPLLVKFPTSPRPQAKFQFCDMWCKHKDFAHIIASNLPIALKLIKQEGTSQTCSLSCSKIPPMCKIERIKYRVDNTRLFHAKAKQRKLTTYIYSIKDLNGNLVEGFDQIKEEFKKASIKPNAFKWQGGKHYKVRQGYEWLPTKKRLARFMPQHSLTYSLCNVAEEDEAHLFFTCSYVKGVWAELDAKLDSTLQRCKSQQTDHRGNYDYHNLSYMEGKEQTDLQ